ncbi:MAG: hypothetical protein AB7E49_08430 [Campylobacterales bacterium]
MEVGGLGSALLNPLAQLQQTRTPQQAAGAQNSEKMSDLSQAQKSIKEQTALLKNDNELFGALKTLEKSITALGALVSSAATGELDEFEAVSAINERMAATRYKNENLYEHFPLSDGSTLDIRERLQLTAPAELPVFGQTLGVVAKEAADSLGEVKERIMGGAKSMGESAQRSYERSGLDTVNPSGIVANTNVDYLKEQFKKLMQ